MGEASVCALDGVALRQTPFGTVPESWPIKQLSECAEVQTGVAKGRRIGPGECIEVPYLRVANVQDGYLDLSEMKQITIKRTELSRFALQDGDVVLTEGGDFDKLGRGFVWDGEVPGCVHQNHIFAVRVDRSMLSPEFFAYLAQSPYGKRYFLSVAHKTTNLACINTTKLKALPVPIPPFPEQRAIAHVLRTVQRAKEATDKVIAATKELKRSLMRHLLSFGPVGLQDVGCVAQAETEIGAIPKEWEVAELRSVLQEPLRNGHSARASNSDAGIRTLTLTAVTQKDFSICNTKVTIADPERVRDMWLKDQDIFVERANTVEYVGLAALYEGPDNFSIFPDLLVRVRLDHERAVPKFIAEFLDTTPCRNYYKANAKATAGNFPKIDQPTIEKTLVPVPDMGTQQAIAAMARHVDEKLRTEVGRAEALDTIFNSLLHNLMTGKVRVHDLPFAPIRKE